MLRLLTIRDFVIVDRIELDFAAGFGALTGETGAGKSILIDALALALGERADAGVVRSGAEKAEVTACFEATGLAEVGEWLATNDFEAGDEILLRRVVDRAGRSRAYINGSPATAQQLRELGEWLVDIHGQHAHQSLLRSEAQRQLFDAHAGLLPLAREVAVAWRAWRAAETALTEAEAGSAAAAQEREVLRWQVRELEGLALAEGEWPTLEQEHRRLAHAASLIEGAQMALELLGEGETSGLRQIARAAARLDDLVGYDVALAPVTEVLASVRAELDEAVSVLRRYADRVELDPGRFAELERRLEAVMSAARKYKVAPEALPGVLAAAQARLASLSAAVDVAALAAAVAQARERYLALAGQLSAGRRQAAGEMGAAVTALMRDLALGGGRFEVALPASPSPAVNGLEQVEFQIAGLASDVPRPLAKVASGGELSRISLAIQVLTSRSARVPTLIFDEVDVGIGGGVAQRVGQLLRQLGQERQVLCVTHLPQVAAQANWQWQVSKRTTDDGVRSTILPLDAEGRVLEIARMLGGVELTEITRQHARELLGGAALPSAGA